MEYELNDIVELKKNHPCNKSKQWRIIRMGADIKLKCLGCDVIVMLPREKFNKKIKKVIKEADLNV